jgi:ribosomal-protein-alanine N-acetyltransferase
MRPLETERLILRSATMDDLEAVYQALVVEQEDEPLTIDDVRDEIQFDLSLAKQPLGQWFGRPSIFLKSENRYIGFCPFMPRLCTPEELSLYGRMGSGHSDNPIEAEIGWALSMRYRGKGYATEAAKALVEYGFTELKLRRIVAFTERDNVASINVMKRIGMQIGTHPLTTGVVGIVENSQYNV